VEVQPGGLVRASADAHWVRVVVEQGEVQLEVEKRVPGGPGFEVAAGPYRFRVLGTKFRVVHSGDAPVELWVQEGRVAVTRAERLLGVVEAGGSWSGRAVRADAPPPRPRAKAIPAAFQEQRHRGQEASAEPAPAEAPGPAAPPPPAAASRGRCAELAAASSAREAVTCYQELADAGNGIAAETALYEVGRLRRDELGDAAGALAAFESYRNRFPRGMLRTEVALSVAELLPKLNRHREALDEITRLLDDGSGRERAPELHFLRANIYREVLEDYARAERDYAAVEAARAPAVGDATFFRGVCLQALGRSDDARAVFLRYLATHGRYSEEARRRLGRLAR
jgi:hypothetical protein